MCPRQVLTRATSITLPPGDDALSRRGREPGATARYRSRFGSALRASTTALPPAIAPETATAVAPPHPASEQTLRHAMKMLASYALSQIFSCPFSHQFRMPRANVFATVSAVFAVPFPRFAYKASSRRASRFCLMLPVPVEVAAPGSSLFHGFVRLRALRRGFLPGTLYCLRDDDERVGPRRSNCHRTP
jgi:hypothetical protein